MYSEYSQMKHGVNAQAVLSFAMLFYACWAFFSYAMALMAKSSLPTLSRGKGNKRGQSRTFGASQSIQIVLAIFWRLFTSTLPYLSLFPTLSYLFSTLFLSFNTLPSIFTAIMLAGLLMEVLIFGGLGMSLVPLEILQGSSCVFFVVQRAMIGTLMGLVKRGNSEKRREDIFIVFFSPFNIFDGFCNSIKNSFPFSPPSTPVSIPCSPPPVPASSKERKHMTRREKMRAKKLSASLSTPSVVTCPSLQALLTLSADCKRDTLRQESSTERLLTVSLPSAPSSPVSSVSQSHRLSSPDVSPVLSFASLPLSVSSVSLASLVQETAIVSCGFFPYEETAMALWCPLPTLPLPSSISSVPRFNPVLVAQYTETCTYEPISEFTGLERATSLYFCSETKIVQREEKVVQFGKPGGYSTSAEILGTFRWLGGNKVELLWETCLGERIPVDPIPFYGGAGYGEGPFEYQEDYFSASGFAGDGEVPPGYQTGPFAWTGMEEESFPTGGVDEGFFLPSELFETPSPPPGFAGECPFSSGTADNACCPPPGFEDTFSFPPPGYEGFSSPSPYGCEDMPCPPPYGFEEAFCPPYQEFEEAFSCPSPGFEGNPFSCPLGFEGSSCFASWY